MTTQHESSAVSPVVRGPLVALWAGWLLTLVSGSDAAAQNYWTGGVNDWFDSTIYWSSGFVPGSGDTVVINNGGTPQVTTSGAVAGTLSIGDGSGSGYVTVQNSGSSLTVGNDILIGTAGTAGGLSLSSSATVTANRLFIGANGTYSDDSSSSLMLTSGGSTPTIENDSSSAVTIHSAVTLQAGTTFNATSGDLTFAGVIGDGGSGYGLSLNGPFTMTFSGANTYSGGTTLNSGTLVVGNDAALGTGTLTINGGTLDVQDGATHTLANAVVLQAAGTINTTSGNLALGGVISESGGSYGLTVGGPGTLTLSGANTYSGGTTLNAGTLSVQNSSALGSGSVTVNGGTLSVDTPVIVAVGGNYSQGGGTLLMAVGGTGAGTYSQVNVTGAATFSGGTLQIVLPSGSSYQPKNLDQVTLLTSSGLTGLSSLTFVSSISASPLLQATLTEDATSSDVILTWNQTSFTPYALTPNQQAVARALDTAAKDLRMASVINELDYLPGGTGQLPSALELISPAQLTSMFTLGFASAEVQGYNLLNRLGDLRAGSTGFSASGLNLDNPTGTLDALPQFVSPKPADVHTTEQKSLWRQTADNPWGVFVGGAGEFIGVNGDANTSGYHITSGGLTVGADYRLSDQLAVGLALGYANSTVSLTGDGRITANSGRADAYGVWFNNGFHVEGMVGGGYCDYDTQRQGLGTGGTTSTATGNTDGGEVEGLLGGGYDWQKGPWTFGPQALLQYTRVDINNFTENGSLLPLQIQSQSADSLRSQLGAHVIYQTEIGRTVLMPEFHLGWRHEYLDRSVGLDSRFANGAGNVFTVYGPQLGRDSAVVGVGFSVRWTRDISVFINYDAELGRANYSLQCVSGGVRIRI